MLAQLLPGVAALLLFPGALVSAIAGIAAEGGAAWALGRGGGARTALSALGALRTSLPRPPALSGAAALLALLAATQLAIPFSPLPATDRNTLVATAALAGASWLAWAAGWGGPRCDPRFALAVQAGWLLAVLLPSVEPQNLRPQVLGAITVPELLPLKIACAVLFLACLPGLLQLLPETAPQGIPGRPGRRLDDAGFTVVRALLWVPGCGLFASLFFPPGADDAAGLLRFVLLAAGAAALAVALAAYLERGGDGRTARLYRRLILPFAGFTAAVAILTAIVG